MLIKKTVSMFKTRTFKLVAFLALLATSVLIGLAMLLGNEAGQFVIRVRDERLDKSIAITTDYEDTDSYKSTLQADGMTGMTDYSAEYFVKMGYDDLDAMTASTGSYQGEGNSLYCYTFYIVNTTSDGSNVGVNVAMSYSKVSNGVDKAIRVMTYARSTDLSAPSIYQASDDTDIDYQRDYGYVIEPVNFYQEIDTNSTNSTGEIFVDQHYTIGNTASEGERQNYMKYSVFFWLEGNDPDCNESILSGTIKFELSISVSM